MSDTSEVRLHVMTKFLLSHIDPGANVLRQIGCQVAQLCDID